MIICTCRDIKETDYDTFQELADAIMQPTQLCGKCQKLVIRYEKNISANSKCNSSNIFHSAWSREI